MLLAALMLLARPGAGQTDDHAGEEAIRAMIASNIAEQIDSQWVLPPGAAEDPVRVTLAIELSREGLVTANTTRQVAGGSSQAVRDAATEAALQAVNHYLSEPFVGLPAEHYDIWKSFTMTLDPARRPPE